MEDHVLELGQIIGQRGFEIGFVEEFGVGKSSTNNTLIARDDGFAVVLGDEVGSQDEFVGELAGRRIAQTKAFLVGADGGDDRFFGHLEEGFVERTHHHDRPFDQPGDFFEQTLVYDQIETLGEGELFGISLDDLLASVDIEDDLGLFQRLHVIVETADLDGLGRHEAVAEGYVAGRDHIEFEGHDFGLLAFGAEGRGDGAQRAHPFQPSIAPAHGLAPGEGFDGGGQDVLEDVEGRSALLFDHRNVEIALLLVGLDLGFIDARKPRTAQKAIDRLLGCADLGALALFARIGRGGGQAGDGQGEAARRCESAGAFIGKTVFDQRIGDRLLEVLGGPALQARRDFLGEKLKQQFGHGRGLGNWNSCGPNG